jgi:hypothetical protein
MIDAQQAWRNAVKTLEVHPERFAEYQEILRELEARLEPWVAYESSRGKFAFNASQFFQMNTHSLNIEVADRIRLDPTIRPKLLVEFLRRLRTKGYALSFEPVPGGQDVWASWLFGGLIGDLPGPRGVLLGDA